MIISLLFSDTLLFFAIFIALVISISLHEFSHVLVAKLLGDNTGEQAGRLTLNPLAHLDWMGTLAILLIGFGWGKPAPFNPYNLRQQRFGPALVALGGPSSNLVLLIIFGILLKVLYPILGPLNYLTIFLQVLVTFNGILMVFNLIPIPPLDGSHILEALLGARFARISEALNLYGPRILLGIILVSILFNIPIFSYLIYPVLGVITKIIGIPLFF